MQSHNGGGANQNIHILRAININICYENYHFCSIFCGRIDGLRKLRMRTNNRNITSIY